MLIDIPSKPGTDDTSTPFTMTSSLRTPPVLLTRELKLGVRLRSLLLSLKALNIDEIMRHYTMYNSEF